MKFAETVLFTSYLWNNDNLRQSEFTFQGHLSEPLRPSSAPRGDPNQPSEAQE